MLLSSHGRNSGARWSLDSVQWLSEVRVNVSVIQAFPSCLWSRGHKITEVVADVRLALKGEGRKRGKVSASHYVSL